MHSDLEQAKANKLRKKTKIRDRRESETRRIKHPLQESELKTHAHACT